MIKYKAIYKGGTGEIVEKKSRFIAHVKSVSTIEEAQEFVEKIKKEYWDARHNCYAFSIGVDQVTNRCNDDGEPGGTAGKPILEVITGSGVKNIVIVVTRYFGGTLLGTGGLVRAYTDASKAGLENSVIIEKIPGKRIAISTDYSDLGKIQYILAENNIVIEYTDYSDKVKIFALAPEDEKETLKKKLVEATGGRVGMEEQQSVYFGMAEGEVHLYPDEV